MPKTPAMNIQDSFLNQIRKDGSEVKIALLDGTTIIGQVRGFDNFTVIVNCRGAQHLLYKHAIAQVISRRSSSKGEQDASRPAAAKSQSAPPPAPPPADPPDPPSFNPIDLSGLQVQKKESE